MLTAAEARAKTKTPEVITVENVQMELLSLSNSINKTTETGVTDLVYSFYNQSDEVFEAVNNSLKELGYVVTVLGSVESGKPTIQVSWGEENV